MKSLQTIVRRLKWAAEHDKKCLIEARAIYPPQTHGPTGQILWKDSEADNQLKKDMADGLHLTRKPPRASCNAKQRVLSAVQQETIQQAH